MSQYACSDFHGRYDLAKLAISHLEPDDHLFYLGDAIDRGPRSLDALNLLINHPQVTFLLGNHEDMMLKVMTRRETDIVKIDCYQYSHVEAEQVWYNNGGTPTAEELINLRERAPKAFQTLMDKVSNAKRLCTYTNALGQHVVLSHAGFTPGKLNPDPDQQLWDRDHIFHGWDISEDWPQGPEFENTIIVHGHTPFWHFSRNKTLSLSSPYWYCQNHKVCIDCWSAISGLAMMTNLDTWKNILLKAEDYHHDL